MSLNIAQYRFELDPVEEIHLPAQNGGVVLGENIGRVFKEACCPHWPEWKDRECAGSSSHNGGCPVRQRCAYSVIFEPISPPGSRSAPTKTGVPKPFVFKPPLGEKTFYNREEPIQLDLLLTGTTKEYLPYFIAAFKSLEDRGIGVKKNCRRGRFRFRTVGIPSGSAMTDYPRETSVYPSYSACGDRDNFVRNIYDEVTLEKILERTRALNPFIVTIRFLTPTILHIGGTVVGEPEFHHIVKCLSSRVSALARYYGDGPLPWDFTGMNTRAEKVRRTGSDIRWIGPSRRCDKATKATKDNGNGCFSDMIGFVGKAVFEGDLREFLPLLSLGEYLHVGNSAAFGLGRYDLEKVKE